MSEIDQNAEWEPVRLGDVARIVNGSTPARAEPAYWDGSIPWATPSDITACSGNTLNATSDYLTEKGLKRCASGLLPAGTVLMTSRATVGAVRMAGVPMATNQGFKNILPNRDIDGWFLFYKLQTLKAQYERFGIGTTFLEVNRADTARLSFKRPVRIETQTAIARILRTVDALIEQTEALIEKQRQIKQGMLHDLFTRGVDANGQLRPPQHEAPEVYRETKLGWVPKEWEVDVLNQGLELLTDYEANGSFEVVRLNVKVYDEPNYAWYVRATDLERGLELDQVRYVDKASYDFLTKTVLSGGEVAVTKRGEIGKVYRIPHAPVPITLAPNMYLLRLNERLDPNYLFHYFKSSEGQHQLLRNNASTTLGALYKDDVKAMLVPYPRTDEQLRIAQRLDLFGKGMDNEVAYLNKCLSLKAGLMQDLLTGRMPVDHLVGSTNEKVATVANPN